MGPLSPEHPDDETFDRLLIVRPEGRLFFMNAQNVFAQNRLALTPCQNSRASDARLLTYRLLVLRPALPLSA